MPKVDIRDDKGIVVSKGSGFYRNDVQCEASAATLDYTVITQRLGDITADSTGTFTVAPHAGTIVRWYACNAKAMVTADGTPTLALSANDGAGGAYSVITTMNFTAESPEATVIDSGALSADVVAGACLRMTTTGGGDSSNSVDVIFTIVLQRT
tara:strand:- start:3861 stop:4322 length:462 start_codon:yes stop_codon:yes gene_type:complete